MILPIHKFHTILIVNQSPSFPQKTTLERYDLSAFPSRNFSCVESVANPYLCDNE
jgi:hypothetical protein